MRNPIRLGLIGPDQTQPCGIADYTARLAEALASRCELLFVPFQNALMTDALRNCDAILVQYERSLVPDKEFLAQLSHRYSPRVFVVPHEVYHEDPFAFPFSEIRSSFAPFLWLKQWKYWLTHREYAQEKTLQKKAYLSNGVFPLSDPSADILRPLAGSLILKTIPLAFFHPPELDPSKSIPSISHPSKLGPPRLDAFFPTRPQWVIGIFGFLNPGLDYDQILDLLQSQPRDVCLLILGGKRHHGDTGLDIESQAAIKGLQGRVRVTGYLPESELSAYLKLCDFFVSPMRFKSTSSSLLTLLDLGKPILASSIPLTQYLQKLGAPLDLYEDAKGLEKTVDAIRNGTLMPRENGYRWTFSEVAEAYLHALDQRLKIEGQPQG